MYLYYAFLNAAIMAAVMYLFNMETVVIAKVSLISLVLMTLRMHIQFGYTG